MKPTPFQFLIGSRYTLPLWLGLAGYFWFYKLGGDWNALTQDQQIATVMLGGLFVIPWLLSFPTVFFYEREQALYRKSAMSPEERWQKQTVRQTIVLVLVAAALLYGGFQWWKSQPVPQPVSTPAVLGMGSVSVLAGTVAYRKLKSSRSPAPAPEQPAIVSWCLPVAKQSSIQVIQLPDYCQRVMTREKKATVSQA
ncbi:MAG: hypothetical protein CV089_08920 [Nitrospira sp. WS110]|nr:hypothetical protein [Nitrospira sp. WS110]